MSTPQLSTLKPIMSSQEIPLPLTPFFLLLLLLLVIAVTLFLLYKRWHRPTPDARTRTLQRLKAMQLDGSLTQEALYQWTLDVKHICKGKEDSALKEILQRLLPYKYHADAIMVDKTTLAQMRAYTEALS